jgi:N-terminal acetyltransferase B complex non-catalytic subunit
MSSAREDEIFNAVENGTYRFALQQCQKLIKKYPKSTYYEVLNNYVLLESGKEEQSLTNSLAIMAKTPNDIKSLILLNRIFNKCHKPKEAQLVYENAAKKYPSFEILTQWFQLGCENGDYRTLQKASIALKNFQSGQRLFHLWAAFNSYLAANNDDATTIEKSLFPKLGLKIAQDLKPMKREQEVFVLVKLLQLNGQLDKIPDEIWEFTGKDKLDLELQIILLDTLDKLEDWQRLYETSILILVDYKLDDFNTWKHLIKSGLKLDKHQDVLKVISDYNNTRNSQLALVEYNLQAGNHLEESVFEYLSHLGTKNCAFLDIKNYISKIDSAKLLSWLEEQTIPEGEKGLIWTVNVLKFKAYFQRDTIFMNPDFIKENIANFNKYQPLVLKKVKTDFFPGDEFLLFIVESLLTKDFSLNNIVLSIIILENAALKDVHEFHIRLWLIQLYTLINCHTQARVHYDVLKVKQVQHDIFDHYLISRIGSILPSYDDFLKTDLQNYEKIEEETVYYTKVGFNKGAFNKLQGILEFQDKISKSALKTHVSLQGLKIGRLVNDKSIISYYNNVIENLQLDSEQYDNRDFKVFWNIGIDEELPLKSKVFANIPENLEEYNKIDLFLLSLVSGSSETGSEFDISSLTEIEKWSFSTILEVSKFLNKQVKDTTEIITLFQTIPKIPNVLTWEASHNIITIIDTTKSVQSMIATSLRSGKNYDKVQLNELKELNLKVLQNLREDTILSKRKATSASIDSLETQIQNDSLLKDLNIDRTTTNRVFEIIRQSNYEAFKILRIL